MRRFMMATEWPTRVWGRIALGTSIFGCAALVADRSAAFAQALAPFNLLTARATCQILHWLGMDVQREVATLTHPGGFSYQIALTCTGLIPGGLLAAAILCGGSHWRSRLWAAGCGVVAVLILNLVRLVSLFYIGVRYPGAFGFAHSVVWQGLTLAFVVGFFLLWKLRGIPASASRQHIQLNEPSNCV